MRTQAFGWLAVGAWLVLAGAAPAQELRTLKERLSDKASDDQRVDNCHVPAERRGPVPRPDCPAKPPAAAFAAVSPGRR
jgi:hypothetical protein